MELIIPGEQHFYMKAVNAAERQRWLVALGSSKACLTDTRTKKEKGNYKFFPCCGNVFLKHKCKLSCSLVLIYPKEIIRNVEFMYVDVYHSKKKNCKECKSLNFGEWFNKLYGASIGWYVIVDSKMFLRNFNDVRKFPMFKQLKNWDSKL